MANYSKGINRIFYKTKSGYVEYVQLYFIQPDLQKKGPIQMFYIDDGVFYADINFPEFGPYIVTIYENGKQKQSDILRVERPDISSRSRF